MVQFDPETNDRVTYISAYPCIQHTGVYTAEGIRKKTKHNMFVDDNLMAETKAFILLAILSIIEYIVRMFGCPKPEYRKSPLSMENIVKDKCSYQKIQLDKLINKRNMTVQMTFEMNNKLIQ